MNTADQLLQVFNDNFVAYYRSHAAHVNITGRNFRSDHKLLEGVYTRRQDQIDVLGELLRTLQETMPTDLFEILSNSDLPTDAIEGTADELLRMVMADLEQLRDCYIELEDVAEEDDHEEISNYAQEQILDLNKSLWMLRSTLD
jgi:starvation-inducible DNA-binding protein